MTVGVASLAIETMLGDGAAYLAGRGVEDPRLEAEHLLAHILGVPRLHLYLDLDRSLGPGEAERYQELLRRRRTREPLQYILGSAPFRDLELRVDPRVAIPRPETEYLIDALMELVRRDGHPMGDEAPFGSALEIGTGSGAIAISLATEGLAGSVTATDVSPEALAVAIGNARRAGARGIEFLAGDSLAPVGQRKFDLVISNPPYLTRAEWLTAQPEVREWEPRVAMHGGGDGLDVVRSVAAGVGGVLRPGGWFGLEVGSGQVAAVVALLRRIPALGAPGNRGT
ncbi:MAG: peptide chain release factor N(5)-glutamine methyltransferase, partial [Gemmatimonadetes bacterium]|nr:peptide chain release factor N(5)-glutamine methyltransferase [Gemmatimonadota bacterium]